jgi:hypothetical protein
MLDPLLFRYEVICISLLWLGLKYFYPRNPWVWWMALFVGMYAGYGIWYLEQITIPLLDVPQILIERERYPLLINLGIGSLGVVATMVIPTLAVLTFVKRLLRR